MKFLVVASLGGIVCLLAEQAWADDLPFVRAARQRQETIRSIEMKLQQTETHTAGSLTQVLGHGGQGSAKPNLPPQDTTLECTNLLVIDGDRYRFENNSPIFNRDGEFFKSAQWSLFDGKHVKTFLPRGTTGDRNPIGTIEANSLRTEITDIGLTPVMRWMRPLNPVFGSKPLSDARPTGVVLTIDGDACQEFVTPSGPDTTKHYWLTADKDYLARRISIQKKDIILFQTEIQYEKNELCGWQPASWVVNVFSPQGELQAWRRIGVVEITINTDQPDDRFEMLFPPKTDYYDDTDGKCYRVQADGKARQIDHMYGEELEEVVLQPGDSWYRAHRWMLTAGIVGLCGGVLFIGYRGWKRSQTASANVVACSSATVRPLAERKPT